MSQNSKPDEFEQYLQGKSALTQLYAELPASDVPGHLDAAILAEAHRAVGARPGGKSRRRWTIPLGMVATLFVVVMVSLPLPYMLKDAASPQQYKEEKIAAMMDQSMAEQSAAVPEERKKLLVMKSAKSNITRNEVAPLAAEADAYSKPYAPKPAIPQELNAVENKPLGATSGLVSPSVMAPAPAKAAINLQLRESSDFDQGRALSKTKKRAAQAEGEGIEAHEQRAPAAASAAPQPAQLERTLKQPLKDEASDANLRPEDWLKRIKKLRQQGKLEEAKKELAAFKKHYPDYPVPEALESR